MRPGPDDVICDPACGTGGFLLAAHDFIAREHAKGLGREQKRRHLKYDALRGYDSVSRLCAMNFLLHGVGPMAGEDELPIRTDDALRQQGGVQLCNPVNRHQRTPTYGDDKKDGR